MTRKFFNLFRRDKAKTKGAFMSREPVVAPAPVEDRDTSTPDRSGSVSPALAPQTTRAYKQLAEREPDLVKDYTRHIRRDKDESLADQEVAVSDVQAVKDMVELLQNEREKKQWKFSVRSKDRKVRDQLAKLVKLCSLADRVVKQGVSAQPYAALAWSAGSVFLPLLKGGLSNHEAMVKGFATISDLQLY